MTPFYLNETTAPQRGLFLRQHAGKVRQYPSQKLHARRDSHLVIDSTGLKVFGEWEWKVKQHGQEKRRVWRKLHLAVDAGTPEVICADLSLNNVTDAEAFPGLIRQTHRRV